jgi:hypothetical protein
MKLKTLIAILGIVSYLFSGLVLAEESNKKNKYNHHHMSKRPHKKIVAKTPPANDATESENEEGMSNEETIDDVNHENLKKIRSKKLSRRPHMQHSTDSK